MLGWRPLDPVLASSLAHARRELHWAAQIPSAAGASRIPARPDYSHTNLGWSPRHEALLSHPLGDDRLQAGLRPRDLTLVLVDAEGDELTGQSLVGRTLAGGLRWLGGALADHGGPSARGALARPTHDLPAHPVGEGAPFVGDDGAALLALADWFADAHQALEALAARHAGASPVRCWPHHFDIATLIPLEPAAGAGEEARSIGAGMTPGDASCPAPYFSVSPWPYPEEARLPELAHGRWHTEGWLGAMRVGTELPVDGQLQEVEAFLDEAAAACRLLLEPAQPPSSSG